MNTAAITTSEVDTDDLAAVAARIDEHERLSRLLKAAIESLEDLPYDLWVGMGTDGVLVKGASLKDLMDQFRRSGVAEGTTVAEFLSAEPPELVL